MTIPLTNALNNITTAELRNLTVQNVGGNKYGNAVFASSGSVVTLRDVTISSSGELACTNCGGIGFSNGGTARLVNSIITMSVHSGDSADAVVNTGTITIFGSELHGAPFTIYNGFSRTPPARVIDSQVDGTLGGSGPPICVGAYNASYAAGGASCS